MEEFYSARDALRDAKARLPLAHLGPWVNRLAVASDRLRSVRISRSGHVVLTGFALRESQQYEAEGATESREL